MRKEGNFIFNTQHLNDGENKILCRRPQKRNPRSDNHYRVCPSCKGYVSKLTLRRHYRRCSKDASFGIRNIVTSSRKFDGNISKEAGQILRDEVFPVFRDSPAVDIIRHDPLIIARGNMLCSKYRHKHMQKMIRNQLKMLGEFLLEIKKLNSAINEFQDVFCPRHFKYVITAINKLGRLDERVGVYGSPSTASALCTTIKQCARNLMSRCIIDGNLPKKQDVENFYHLMVDECPALINTTVSETMLQRRRRKIIRLPSTRDIKSLSEYCTRQKEQLLQSITGNGFSYEQWLSLAECTLIAVQVFNRRRAGEIERCKIEDFRTHTNLEENDECNDRIDISKKYVRFEIRGKRARGVPVLLNQNDVMCVETMLKYRELAGVPHSNPYIFGIRGSTIYKHLEACKLMQTFSLKCGAENPDLLRGTLLRKHFATKCADDNLAENEVNDAAMQLGHERHIHQSHYRQPVRGREIVGMSKLLEKAQGKYYAFFI